MTFNALIIDDERLARLTLRKDLEKFPEITIVGEANGIASAKKVIEKTNPDLLFLDIQLTDGSGFDLLNQIEFSGKIVFITAYDEYALRAFEVNAIDYLMKPVSTKRLREAINKLVANGIQEDQINEIKLDYSDRLMVMHKKSVNFLLISSITHITASRECSYIHDVDGKEYLTNKNIGDWEKRLPDKYFCRIHRSTIINFDYIVKINYHSTGTADVLIQNAPEPLNISRNYFKKLKGRYSI